jgi:hypothetical protein
MKNAHSWSLLGTTRSDSVTVDFQSYTLRRWLSCTKLTLWWGNWSTERPQERKQDSLSTYISTVDMTTHLSSGGSISSAWAPSFILLTVYFLSWVYILHAFFIHLLSIPCGPSLLLGSREIKRNRIPKSLISSLCVASINLIISKISFQLFV